MRQYYWVFDMYPHDEDSRDWIQVGIAPKNPNMEMLYKQYDNTSDTYAPLPNDSSHSTYVAPKPVPPKPDPLSPTPPGPTPVPPGPTPVPPAPTPTPDNGGGNPSFF